MPRGRYHYLTKEEIERLLDVLPSYGDVYEKISEDEWNMFWEIEMEVRVGKDRKAAKEKLEKFIEFLESKRKQ